MEINNQPNQENLNMNSKNLYGGLRRSVFEIDKGESEFELQLKWKNNNASFEQKISGNDMAS